MVRIVLSISIELAATFACFPKIYMIGAISNSINLSIYVFIQKLKLSLAKSVLDRESDSGLKNILAIITGKSHRLLSQCFITTVLSIVDIIRPNANSKPNVININGPDSILLSS
jgi:hypothetical protein